MAEDKGLTEEAWSVVKGVVRPVIALVGTAAGVVVLYKGLEWLFSLV